MAFLFKESRLVVGKIEHLGIAVRSLEEATIRYTKLLGVEPYKTEEVASERVKTVFFLTGTNKIELLEATDENSAIAKFIERKGEGLHHVAFDVSDIIAEMKRLKNEGYSLLQDQPKQGADNKLICFVHPRDALGVLIELCQEIP